MLFSIRTLAQRSLRAQARRATLSVRPALSRRGYADVHGTAQKTSELPWLISAVGVTGVGLAYLLSGPPKGAGGAHGPAAADAIAKRRKEETQSPRDKSDSGASQPSAEDKPAGDDSAPKGADDPSNPDKATSVGRAAPPPPSDNRDLAEAWEERKEGQKELNKRIRAGDTKAATSSSQAPSKKTRGEDPREDPQKGEGEAVKKGGSKDE
ncbi:hypothetical protein F5B22DRAFT_645796 [Xylaria bambusicola]|uniref:uncharacterized protein n=1 Tax=Xylaria bambusicola TaxID=326684 RepID=UPI002008BC37|nr:uncharacterized protein F5B22DRAFT_645796 [Xylaria bambusicola]KAI0517617.1 hypothetical protein F5B22DRAFT_645796 [Xylaria bambusicola]